MLRSLTTALAIVAFAAASTAGVRWTSADSLPLLGKAVDDASTTFRYQRLPDSLETQVKRPDLFRLGRQSAGMAIRFRSDAPSIHAKWKSTQMHRMNHMTTTGTRGLDLYVMQPDSSWTSLQTARPDPFKAVNEVTVIQNIDPVEREYMLYLSLYDGVDSLYIGVPDGYSVEAPAVALPAAESPIVYYGTSITQGGCANRPGMAATNILQRRLNRDIVNLGFSGNGQLDIEVARVMAAVERPALYVLDFLPNVSYEQLDTLFFPFVETLRAAHPEVPILVIEDPDYPSKRFDRVARDRVAKRRVLLHSKIDELMERDPAVTFIPADGLIGYDAEATVDGLHFTDLGFLRFADAIEPTIRRLLQ